jgi:hypothetical protein
MNAKQRIEKVESNILYRKQGKRYIQVTDDNSYFGLQEGYWLVKIASGCTSIRQCVYPDKAEIQAAAHNKQDKLLDIIRKAGEARPQKIKLTEEEHKDWQAFIEKHGDSFSALCYPSLQEITEKIINEILKKD